MTTRYPQVNVMRKFDLENGFAILGAAVVLVGIFAAGLRPTGNKDPFALRRGALGMVRILLEGGLQLPLNRILALAAW